DEAAPTNAAEPQNTPTPEPTIPNNGMEAPPPSQLPEEAASGEYAALRGAAGDVAIQVCAAGLLRFARNDDRQWFERVLDRNGALSRPLNRQPGQGGINGHAYPEPFVDQQPLARQPERFFVERQRRPVARRSPR